ncbi:MAG: signal peptidase I [Oscillospiraceae bacterium]
MVDNQNSQEIKVSENSKKKSSVLDNILEWLESFAFAIFVVILIFTFVLRTVVVKGKSMEPNFHDKDRLIITHIIDSPDKGDVVVVNSYNCNKTLIKRCIGTAGDDVVINYNTNKITVNGKEIADDYIKAPMIDSVFFNSEYQTASGIYEYKVPEGKIFVLGDNRNNSKDSRFEDVSFIDNSDVLGKVVLRIMPFEDFGIIKSQL